MPTREIAFERFGLALETPRGTAAAAPTHLIPMSGVLKPEFERATPAEQRGVLNDRLRSKVTKRWSSWSGDPFGLDVYYLPLLLNMTLAPLTTPTTPTSATLTRLWAFSRVMTADTQRSATAWWDEPATGSDRAPFAMVDDMTITSDATGSDTATQQFAGFAQDAAQVASPAFPALLTAPLITPLDMQAWLDTSLAIGATALENSLLSASLKLSGMRSQKFYPAGPAAARTFTGVGVKKNHPTLDLVFEYSAALETLLRSDSILKTRVKMNGPAIETVAGPLTYYHAVECDLWGTPDSIDFGSWADGTNRTISCTLGGEYDATAGTDLIVRVYNDRTVL